jgi:hypothetical protein
LYNRYARQLETQNGEINSPGNNSPDLYFELISLSGRPISRKTPSQAGQTLVTAAFVENQS